MPTFPTGPIVTVPTTRGAPTITAEVINAMWTASAQKSNAGNDYIDDAVAFADPAPSMAMVDLDTSYLPPPAPAFPPLDPNNGEAIYDDKLQDMLAMIQGAFDSFMAQFYPNSAAYDAALAWCEAAIVTGGSGVSTPVEVALWQRDRARIIADSERTASEAEKTWSNRRFPLPPGTLTNQLNQINLDMGRKLAESSRTTAIKTFDTEIENTRFAIKTVVDDRKTALDSALAYVRTIMLGPQTAMELATGLAGLQTQYFNSLTAYYTAQVTAAQPQVQLAIADANIKTEIGKANLAAQSASIDAKVKAQMTAAQMMASQASSGINAINAQSSISGQDVTSN